MRRSLLFLPFAFAALIAAAAVPAAAEHRLGLGLHSWRSVDDLGEAGRGLDDSGTGLRATYQWAPPGPLALELDVDFYGDGFGGTASSAWSPIGLVVVELGPVYAGAGLGTTVADDFPGSTSDPFYLARFGFELAVFPRIHLDLGADYRIDAWKQLRGSDPGTVSVAAVARVVLFD